MMQELGINSFPLTVKRGKDTIFLFHGMKTSNRCTTILTKDEQNQTYFRFSMEKGFWLIIIQSLPYNHNYLMIHRCEALLLMYLLLKFLISIQFKCFYLYLIQSNIVHYLLTQHEVKIKFTYSFSDT